MSILSDDLYQRVMTNPPMCRVTLWLKSGQILTGDMHVPPMPANMADPFPIYLANNLITMVDPAAIEAWAVTPIEGSR